MKKLTRVTDRDSGCAEKRIRVVGCFKIRMVQDIEKLRSELNIESFRDFLDVIVLKDREVEVHQPWAYHRVSAHISQSVRASSRELRNRQRPITDKGLALRCDGSS